MSGRGLGPRPFPIVASSGLGARKESQGPKGGDTGCCRRSGAGRGSLEGVSAGSVSLEGVAAGSVFSEGALRTCGTGGKRGGQPRGAVPVREGRVVLPTRS